MADGLFAFISEKIEERTELDKLEARGTVRIALKEAGLDPQGVTVEQMTVMLRRTMPRELVARGIEGAEELCEGLIGTLKDWNGDASSSDGESPEEVFRRLGGR